MKQAEQAKLREKRALNWRRQGARADKSITVMKLNIQDHEDKVAPPSTTNQSHLSIL